MELKGLKNHLHRLHRSLGSGDIAFRKARLASLGSEFPFDEYLVDPAIIGDTILEKAKNTQ